MNDFVTFMTTTLRCIWPQSMESNLKNLSRLQNTIRAKKPLVLMGLMESRLRLFERGSWSLENANILW